MKEYSPQRPSASQPQPRSRSRFHHEGTKVTKEEFSRKAAKGARLPMLYSVDSLRLTPNPLLGGEE